MNSCLAYQRMLSLPCVFVSAIISCAPNILPNGLPPLQTLLISMHSRYHSLDCPAFLLN